MSVADRVLAVARAQIGYVEQGGPDGRSGNITKFWDWWDAEDGERDQGMSWCGCFVSWCFDQAGARLDTADRHNGPGYIYCPDAEQHYSDTSHVIDRAQATPGCVLFFHFDGEPNEANHTGLLESFDAVNVTCIEGNTSSGDAGSQSNGGQVARRTRPWSCVRAVIHPPQLDHIDTPVAPQEENMALTPPIPVHIDHATGKGWAIVPGVQVNNVRGFVPRIDKAGALAGVVPRCGLGWEGDPMGEAIVFVELPTPTLVDVDVSVQVTYV